jgi:hypothetical protein
MYGVGAAPPVRRGTTSGRHTPAEDLDAPACSNPWNSAAVHATAACGGGAR